MSEEYIMLQAIIIIVWEYQKFTDKIGSIWIVDVGILKGLRGMVVQVQSRLSGGGIGLSYRIALIFLVG